MTVDTRFDVPAAPVTKIPTFGTASVRVFAPQHVFDLVWAQSARAAGLVSDRRHPTPGGAANENGPGPHSSAA